MNHKNIVIEATATVDGHEYSAQVTCADCRVEVCDGEAHLIATGEWDGGIESDADLGDDVYSALDETIQGAIDEAGLKAYYYWIGARNEGGGLDATGEHGHMLARTAREVCGAVRADYSALEREGHTVCARLEDMSETAELDM